MAKANAIDKRMESVGMAQDSERSATYMLDTASMRYKSINAAFKGKLEILDTKEAVAKYPWVKDYFWKAVSKDKDDFTKRTDDAYDGGYFIRIFKGAKVDLPLQSCMMISKHGYEQRVHNIIISEEGSEANIISGCMLHTDAHGSSHVGISEFFIKEGAKLNFTMVHNWNESTFVRPRSAAVVEKDATFISNYVQLNPVKDLQMYPVATLEANARVSFNSLIVGKGDSLIDIGSKAVLKGAGSRAEMISRIIARDNSRVISRGLIEGKAKSRGHLECKGIIAGKSSKIHAIPELLAESDEAELSHEASLGKIADKEINYLMSRGLSEDEAVSTIIRGFMDVGIFGLPEELAASIKRMMASASKGM